MFEVADRFSEHLIPEASRSSPRGVSPCRQEPRADRARSYYGADVGWVADLVRQGTPVGDLLCPSSKLDVSKVYGELRTMDPTTNTCADSIGGKDQTLPDGSTLVNPCRAIGAASSDTAKADLIRDHLLKKGYNTNYAAGWFLVRGEVEEFVSHPGSEHAAAAIDDSVAIAVQDGAEKEDSRHHNSWIECSKCNGLRRSLLF